MTLPVELWRDIIRRATLVEGAFDSHSPYVSPMDAKLCENSTWNFKLHRENLRTKRATVAVSRTWRYIGLPYLHEIMAIMDEPGFSVHTTIRILTRSHSVSSGRGYGRYVRRLELGSSSHVIAPQLFEVYTMCPNIEVWSFNHRNALECLFPIFTLPRHATKALSICRPDASGFPLQAHLRKMPKLEYLHIGIQEKPLAKLEPVTLPALHTLKVESGREGDPSYTFSIIETWSLPALKHIEVRLDHDSRRVLEKYASQIQALTIVSQVSLPPVPGFADFLSEFSQLHDVVYWCTHPISVTQPMPFIRIGIYCDKLQSIWRSHFDTIFSSPDIYPHLQTIRLLDIREEQMRLLDSSDIQFWEHWILEWRTRNIRFENARGEVICLAEAEEHDVSEAEAEAEVKGENGDGAGIGAKEKSKSR